MGSFGGVGGGGYSFNLHFGDSFLLDHREEELQFKISLTHVLHCLREKRMKFKNGIAIAKNFSPVQTNFKNEITEKLVTLFKKRKCSNRWSTKLVREVSRGKAKEF